MQYVIGYTGYAESEPIEAKSEKEALQMFWEKGLNDLADTEIIHVKELKDS